LYLVRHRETTDAYFDFVVREIHNANAAEPRKRILLSTATGCISVPAKSSSGKATDDSYQPYKPAPIK
jgi:hypothetical protein